MNILHLIESLDPKFGGPSVSVPNLAAAQAAQGHTVRIFTIKGDATDEELAKRDQNIPNIEQVNITYFEAAGLLEKYIPRSSSAALKRIIPEYDILHIHGVWGRVLASAARIAHSNGIKYIFTPRGMLDSWSLQQGAFKKRVAMILGLKNALNHSHYIHALNSEEKEHIEKLGLNARIRVFPNGVSGEIFTKFTAKNTFFKFFPELNGRKYILFLSRIHYKKGIDYLVESFARFALRCKDVDLVVAGPDEGELGFMVNFIKDHNLGDRVHIVGPLYGEKKIAAFVDAECFFLPSRQEGFSMAILESLGFLTPVVITDGCHFPRVADVNAGLVVDYDYDKMADALLTMVDKHDEFEVAAQKLSKEYLWEKIAADVVSSYLQ